MLGWGWVGLLLWLWHMSIIVNETFRRLQSVSSPRAEPKGGLPGQISIHGVGDRRIYRWNCFDYVLVTCMFFYIDQFVQSVTNEHLLPSCPPHNEPPPVVIQSRQPSNSWREQLSKMSPLEHTVTDDTTKTWVEQLERWCDTLVG